MLQLTVSRGAHRDAFDRHEERDLRGGADLDQGQSNRQRFGQWNGMHERRRLQRRR